MSQYLVPLIFLFLPILVVLSFALVTDVSSKHGPDDQSADG